MSEEKPDYVNLVSEDIIKIKIFEEGHGIKSVYIAEAEINGKKVRLKYNWYETLNDYFKEIRKKYKAILKVDNKKMEKAYSHNLKMEDVERFRELKKSIADNIVMEDIIKLILKIKTMADL